MEILKKKSLPKPSVVLDTYWKLAYERQEIFFNKQDKINPITADPIFLKHKFTNAYRASDRVSQFLISNIIYNNQKYSELDMLFRILLFKIFNKPSTWELIESEVGNITKDTFSFSLYNEILHRAKSNNEKIYSGAYIMTSGKTFFGFKSKHSNHLKLLETYVNDNLLSKINCAKSLQAVFSTLLEIPTFGKFLAYQYTIDLNYSELINFSEMDYVVPGPGARDGIKKCFISLGEYSEEDIIKWATDNQENEFRRLNLKFRNLYGRPLQLIDCQNLFCEADKYARVAHPDILGHSQRKRIKQVYKPMDNKINYFYPPKWAINQEVKKKRK